MEREDVCLLLNRLINKSINASICLEMYLLNNN